MPQNRYLPWFGGLILGIGLGLCLFDTRTENHSLKAELSHVRLELELLKVRSARSAVPLMGARWSELGGSIMSPVKQTNDVGHLPAHLNRDDLAAVRKLSERRQQGEYILEFEDPVAKNFRNAAAKSLSAMYASNNAPRLSAAFAELGLSADASQRLQAHQQKIAEASVLAETGISQLLKARYDYDCQVRSLMSEDNYSRYRAFEDSNAANREYNQFVEFANKSGFPVEDSLQEGIVGAIQQAQAYTGNYYAGAYDGIPQPIVGSEKGIPWLEERKAEVTRTANLLSQIGQQLEIPDTYRQSLDTYYKSYIDQLQAGLDAVKPENMEARSQAAREALLAKYKQGLASQQAGQTGGKP